MMSLEGNAQLLRLLGLQDLYSSGYLTELHAFSKMLHGVATLLPDALQVRIWGISYLIG